MTLEEKAGAFPNASGVYLMKDAAGTVLYVGKALDLKKRVTSYLPRASGLASASGPGGGPGGEVGAAAPRSKDNRYQVSFLMKRVRDLEFIVTDNEKEALLLENTLIKKHRPKYNLQLKDDRSYLSLKLSVKDKFPRLYVTRQIKKDGSLYFGPYTSGLSCHQTVDFIEKYFRLRTCSDHEFANRSRPCLQHQIHRCDAPCVGSVSPEAYGRIVEQVRLFLAGKKQDLLREVDTVMDEFAEREDFEKAAQARDLAAAIRETLEKQQAARHRWIDQDALGLCREGERVTLCLINIREGKIWESRLYHLRSPEPDSEFLRQFLNQYYDNRILPDEILLPAPVPDRSLAEALAERRGAKVSLIAPRRGDRHDLVRLARRNAAEGFRHREQKQEETGEILRRLQEGLGLQNLPTRIECFDISNLSGRQAVGSLACLVNGEPFKEGYRRFRIKTVTGPNDFAMMREVLRRRLARIEAGGSQWQRPDLMVIDGGKGQLSAVAAVMNELNLTGIDLAALAKAREGEPADKVFVPGRKNPIRFRPHSGPLHLLMRIRDEAHRFAIAYHKKIRQREFLP